MNTSRTIRSLMLAAGLVLAGPGGAIADPMGALLAHDLKGQALDAHKLEGKVHLVYYWSTDCAVCRDSLPELRANAKGWSDKPFVLVTVNVDKHESDWQGYEEIAALTLKHPPRGLLSVRLNNGQPAPIKLPTLVVVDGKGQVRAHYEGRVEPEAWDKVAELLP